MSQSLTPFIGTRARFMRYGDARIFHGWIQEVIGEIVVVSCPEDPPILIGDRFGFEAFGERTAAAFEASFTGRGELEAIVGTVGGDGSRMVEMAAAGHNFRIVSNIRVQTSTEPMRMRVDGLYSEVLVDGERFQARVADVSRTGAAVIVPREVEKGSPITLRVRAPVEEVDLTGTTVYCRPESAGESWRCGVKFGPLDRITTRRWIGFLGHWQ